MPVTPDLAEAGHKCAASGRRAGRREPSADRRGPAADRRRVGDAPDTAPVRPAAEGGCDRRGHDEHRI